MEETVVLPSAQVGTAVQELGAAGIPGAGDVQGAPGSDPPDRGIPGTRPTEDEPMHPDPWPRRPRPEATGPQLSCELSGPADLRTVRRRLRTWLPGAAPRSDDDPGVVDNLLLVADELATNGLRHGRAPVRIRAARTAEGLLLEISDGDTAHGPVPAVGRDPALGGMGLHIVAELTVARGWDVADGRKHVWAHLPAE